MPKRLVHIKSDVQKRCTKETFPQPKLHTKETCKRDVYTPKKMNNKDVDELKETYKRDMQKTHIHIKKDI